MSVAYLLSGEIIAPPHRLPEILNDLNDLLEIREPRVETTPDGFIRIDILRISWDGHVDEDKIKQFVDKWFKILKAWNISFYVLEPATYQTTGENHGDKVEITENAYSSEKSTVIPLE